jgi:hypothetical protein
VAFLKDEAILNVPVFERFVHNSGLAWIGLFMVLNATFSNSSVISWGSVLLMDQTGENHRPVELTTLVAIGTD